MRLHAYLKVSLFFILLSGMFFLNNNGAAQCGIFDRYYVPLADQLYQHFQYNLYNPTFDTFPMWGYPALMAAIKWLGFDYSDIFYLQYLLFAISFILFLKASPFKNARGWVQLTIVLTFFFYVTMLSHRWPDAIVTCCLFMAARSHLRKSYLTAALFLGIAYNFRTEVLVFLLIYMCLTLWLFKQKKVLLAMLCVLPYMGANLYFHQTIRPTTTNAGGVLYITLGQLKNNPWGRVHRDEETVKYVQQQTEGRLNYPWGAEANQYLKKAFWRDVQSHPEAFAKKVLYNFLHIFRYGYYRGQVKNALLRYERHKTLCHPDDVDKQKPPMWLKMMQTVMKIPVAPLFAILSFIAGLAYIVKNRQRSQYPLYAMIIAQALICAFIQYEPRHISKIVGVILWLVAVRASDNTRSPYS